jgi:hypothetical protein
MRFVNTRVMSRAAASTFGGVMEKAVAKERL